MSDQMCRLEENVVGVLIFSCAKEVERKGQSETSSHLPIQGLILIVISVCVTFTEINLVTSA